MLLLNFSLLLVLWIYYKYGYRWASLIALVISFWILIFIFRGLNPWMSIAIIASINLAVFIPYKFDREQAEEGELENLKQLWDTSRINTRLLAGELQQTKEERDDLERQSLAIIDLYETSKRMTLSLTFPELFNVFKEKLDNHFIFREFKLILIDEHGGMEKILAKDSNEIKSTGGEKALFQLGLKLRKANYLSEEKLKIYRKELKDLPMDIFSLALVPVFFQNDIRAIIILENINQADYEQLVILSRQFELAFKKIKLYQKLQELSITDGLTQTYVRRHFEQRLQEEKNRSLANNMKMTILLIDLDHFKAINDRYGHLVGDVVLKDLSQIVKSNVRETDLVGRWGGEELIVLLVESDIKLARLVAERIRQIIEKNIFKAYDETIKLTISIGIAVFPDEAADIGPLLEKADKALYRAKSLGRNMVFTPLAGNP